MSADVDTVKVIAATVTPTETSTKLMMTTSDKVTVEFDLDDLAIALLALTAQLCLTPVQSRRAAGTTTIHKAVGEKE